MLSPACQVRKKKKNLTRSHRCFTPSTTLQPRPPRIVHLLTLATQVPARHTSSPSWSTWSPARRALASPRSRRRGWPSRRASARGRPCSSRPRRPRSCAGTSPAPTAPPRPPSRASRRPAWRASSTGPSRRPPRGARSSGGRSLSRRATNVLLLFPLSCPLLVPDCWLVVIGLGNTARQTVGVL